MAIDEQLLTYWQAGITTLEQFYSNKLNTVAIATSACQDGIMPLEAVDRLFALTGKQEQTIKVTIAPVVIKKDCVTQNSIFYILCLSAEVTRTGQILPDKTGALPWVPRILTEPTATAPFSVGPIEQFDNHYHFLPPPWGLEGPASWQEQLDYAYAFLEKVTLGAWKWQAYQLGYTLAAEAAIFPASGRAECLHDICFASVAKKRQLWQAILATDEAMAKPSMNTEQVYHASGGHCAHINTKHALSMQQRSVLTQALALAQNEILYVQTSPGTGKTTIIADFIATKWVRAIIDRTPPPSIAIYNKAKQLQKVTILDCLSTGSAWLTQCQRQAFYQPEVSATASKSQIVANFLQQCTQEFGKSVTNLETAKQLLHERIMLLQTTLDQGIIAAHAYYSLMKKTELNYRSYGGIEQRNKTLKDTVEKQLSYFRYLEVLQSLLERQIAPNSKWSKWLALLPQVKARQTQKLRTFFEKHLPDEDVQELAITQMQEYLQNLIFKTEKKKCLLSDVLIQVEADLKQLDITKTKTKRWFPDQIDEEFDLAKLMKFLDTHLRYRIFLTATHYWEAELLQKASWDKTDIFNDYYASKPALMTDLLQQPVDWLMIENAEQLSPLDGFYCVEGSTHLVVMGDCNAVKPNRIPMEIDVNLLRQHDLIETEEDIENLQFKGVLISNGQFNTMAEQIADYKGEAYSLTKQWDIATNIVECQNQLSYTGKLLPCKKNKAAFIADFSYLPLVGQREAFMGSFYNNVEVVAILSWIKQHEASILARYPEYSFADTILICTTFYGQCLALREALSKYNIEINNIELIQTQHNKRAPIVIFSPVYSKADKGRLCFDEGEAMLRNLLVSATEHVIVFGEPAIFDQKLHSASGKFAKFLFGSTKNQLDRDTQLAAL